MNDPHTDRLESSSPKPGGWTMAAAFATASVRGRQRNQKGSQTRLASPSDANSTRQLQRVNMSPPITMISAGAALVPASMSALALPRCDSRKPAAIIFEKAGKAIAADE